MPEERQDHAHPSASIEAKEAKLFRNNRSQAVRIPVEFEPPGDRVLIRREGSALIIEPVCNRPALPRRLTMSSVSRSPADGNRSVSAKMAGMGRSDEAWLAWT